MEGKEHHRNTKVLHVNIVSAKDIAPRKKNKKRNLQVIIKLGNKTQQTTTRKKTLVPVWNETFNFAFRPSKAYKLVLEVSLWDLSKRDKAGGEFIGKLEYSLIDHPCIRSSIEPEEIASNRRSSILIGSEPSVPLHVKTSNGSTSARDALEQYTPSWFDLEPSYADEPCPGHICIGISILDLGEFMHIQNQLLNQYTVPEADDDNVLSTVDNLSPSVHDTIFTRAHATRSPSATDSMTSSFSSLSCEEQDAHPVIPFGKEIPIPVSDTNINIIDASSKQMSIFSESSLKGVLKLDILKCSDLPSEQNSSRGWLFSLSRKSDPGETRKSASPFITVGFSRLTYKTRVIRNSLQPEWNEKMLFPLKTAEEGYLITFSLYHYKKLRNNTLLATASMKVSDLLDRPDESQQLTLYWNYVKPISPISSPTLLIQARFVPARTLRHNFWYTLGKMYDHDENGKLNTIELMTMLESLGCSFTEPIIRILLDPIKAKAVEGEDVPDPGDIEISMDDLVPQLETLVHVFTARSKRNTLYPSNAVPISLSMPVVTLSDDDSASVSSMSSSTSSTNSRDNDSSPTTGTSSEGWEEGRLICLRECPVCHKPWSRARGDQDILTHLAICVSEDASSIHQFIMGGFLTEEYASRKWYTKIMSYLGYGGYRLGKRNGNIFVRHRYSGRLLEEKMPTYIRLGLRLVFQSLGSQKTVESRMVRQLLQYMTLREGKRMDDPSSVKLIRPFVNFFHIHMEEILLPVSQFKTFNEFFYRRLKPDARPLSQPDQPMVAVSPADCRITVFPTITESTRLWIKGSEFSVAELLKDKSMAQYFEGGSVAICRLAPQDYHRFHSPVDGTMGVMIPIPGAYYTVNPMAVRQRIDVFTENARLVSYIYSDHFGKVAYVSVGAMMVGSIKYTCKEGERVSRMDEVGYFAFGGSTIILLFSKDMIQFDADLLATTNDQLETWIRCGDSIGAHPGAAANIHIAKSTSSIPIVLEPLVECPGVSDPIL